jgi:hypothetical protein
MENSCGSTLGGNEKIEIMNGSPLRLRPCLTGVGAQIRREAWDDEKDIHPMGAGFDVQPELS